MLRGIPFQVDEEARLGKKLDVRAPEREKVLLEDFIEEVKGDIKE